MQQTDKYMRIAIRVSIYSMAVLVCTFIWAFIDYCHDYSEFREWQGRQIVSMSRSQAYYFSRLRQAYANERRAGDYINKREGMPVFSDRYEYAGGRRVYLGFLPNSDTMKYLSREELESGIVPKFAETTAKIKESQDIDMQAYRRLMDITGGQKLDAMNRKHLFSLAYMYMLDRSLDYDPNTDIAR